MRKAKLERLESEFINLEELTDNLGRQMSLVTIEKKLEKKNLELEEVRDRKIGRNKKKSAR